jgi:hypothetical protein
MTPREIIELNCDAAKRGALAIWTVYRSPKDRPGEIVARMHEVTRGLSQATECMFADKELERVRQRLYEAGLTRLDRNERDDPVIVETWI